MFRLSLSNYFDTPHPFVRAGMYAVGALAAPVAFHGSGVAEITATVVASGTLIGLAAVGR